jgi:phosphatidylglycerol:prolipoprotein diacylglycerol transferase
MSLPVRWYGLLTLAGFLAGAGVVVRSYGKGLSASARATLMDGLIWAFLGGIVGARLWFVLLQWDYFAHNPYDILAIWQGGQSIQGGIVSGLVIGWLFHRRHRQELPPLSQGLDAAAMGLPLGQAIGRWGNFFNVEAFGGPTDLPWGLFVPLHLRPSQHMDHSFFHPTFAYESLFLLLLAMILWHFYRRHRGHLGGRLLCAYLIAYSVGRFGLEYLRSDSLQLGPLPAAQIVCIIITILSLTWVLLAPRKPKGLIENIEQ